MPKNTVLVRNIKENSVTPVKKAESVLRIYRGMPEHFEIITSPQGIDEALKNAEHSANPVTETEGSSASASAAKSNASNSSAKQ